MSDSHAEQLDPTVLGERVGDDRSPAADYPPDEPLAVDDPNIVEGGVIARDDVASREERLDEPEVGDDEPAPALIETGDDPDVRDDEQQLVADEGDRDDDGPEAAAVRTTDNP